MFYGFIYLNVGYMYNVNFIYMYVRMAATFCSSIVRNETTARLHRNLSVHCTVLARIQNTVSCVLKPPHLGHFPPPPPPQ